MSILDESIIPLAEAVNIIPSSRSGRKLSRATLFRWMLHGVRGVKLESVLVGNSRFTSREAVARFSARLSERADDHCNPQSATPAQRDRDHRNANDSLEKAGW